MAVHSLIDLRAALPRLAVSIEPADPNRDHSSSEWASFPFTRNVVDHMGLAHRLEKLSSEWARPILALRPSSERFRTKAK